MPKILLSHARIATLSGQFPEFVLDDASLLVDGDNIVWAGPMAECPEPDGGEMIDCKGRLTPGLIDCHTHLVYGGNRVDEFEARLEGIGYTEIAKRGGGIRSTVNATRAASESDLSRQCLPRLEQFLSEGVTTLEMKSGYGLDSDNEIKMLRVAARLEQAYPLKVVKTFLGAHASNLVDAVDVFIESIAFNLSQAQRVFETAAS